MLDEIERAAEDVIGDLNSILKSKKTVPGGGAVELELAREVNDYAKKSQGKEKLVIESFAKALLSIPETLCLNCGFEVKESLKKLEEMHSKAKKNSGIDGFVGIVEDTRKSGILEPVNVKEQAIKSATEASSMIIRIDDIIAAKKLKAEEVEF